MFRVRYYDQLIHPDQFEGRLGFVIRALNWLRWKIEVLVQSLVVRYLIRVNSAPRSVLDDFRVDVEVEKLQRDLTSPKRVRPLRVEPSERVVQKLDKPADKLGKILGSRSEQPVRPVPLNEMIGKYALSGRGGRYAHSHWDTPAEDQFGAPEED